MQEELKFLMKDESTTLFNKMYDSLRGGIHIQKQSHPTLFEFIQSNEESIDAFFIRFNATQLCWRGQQREKYYFLNFLEDTTGKTEPKYMKNDILLVGFLLYKVVYIDSNYELNSVRDFQNIIIRDFEHYKVGIIKVLAKVSTREVSNRADNETIKDTIGRAFNLFHKISWLRLDDDYFEFYPAFKRIIDIYQHKIETIDTWLKE